MSKTCWPFIDVDETGVARLTGTRAKVLEIVLDHLAYGWDADQLHIRYPELALSQLHAALGYYYDNQTEFDQEISSREERTEELLKQLENPSLQSRLRATKALK